MKKSIRILVYVCLVSISLSCSSDSGGNNPNDGNNTPQELMADFEIIRSCCAPAGASGRNFEYIEIGFDNRSTGQGLEYTWFYNSTIFSNETNPSEIFSLNNDYSQNTLTFGLRVTDENGETEYTEKSIDIPITQPLGTITFDGITCNINLNDAPPNYPLWLLQFDYSLGLFANTPSVPYDYNDIQIPIDALSFTTDCDISLIGPLGDTIIIALGGYAPVQTGTMHMVSDYPNGPNEYRVRFGNYVTFDSGISSGGITLSGVEEGFNMIAGLSLTGQVTNGSDIKDFSIDLSWIPHKCYLYSSTDCP